MTRKAFIGLSSPTAYFYDNNHQFFKGEPWSWNPILESPQGLITLFDELWFLSRPLCPISLRKESYVKFLDEDSDFIPLIKGLNGIIESHTLDGLIEDHPLIGDIIDLNSNYPNEQFGRYNQIIEQVYSGTWGKSSNIRNQK